MVHTRKPVFKTNLLNIPALDEEPEFASENNNKTPSSAVKVPNSSGSAAAPKSTTSNAMPTSFQGFDIKTDPKIRRQAKRSWFDIDDSSSTATTPFVSASPFEGISGTAPVFPPPTSEEPRSEAAGAAFGEAVAAAEKEEEEQNNSPSTPTKEDSAAATAAVSSPPLKPGQIDHDGAEGFEQDQATVGANLPQYQQFLPPPPPPQRYPVGAAPAYNPYQQAPAFQGPNYGPRSFQPPQVGGFQSHHQQEQAGVKLPTAARKPASNRSSGSTSPAVEGSSSNLNARPANHELMGFLPFYRFDEMALTGDLPSAEMLGADPKQHPKLFLGHVWSRVPTGVIQWMLNCFAPSDATAFGPQLHYNKEGWFRGCLHTSVITKDPQALIYALHKRVLFDHEGVWFAETADQMRTLDEYCRRLRALPQQIRHTKLQSLPCNPLACELAVNERRH